MGGLGQEVAADLVEARVGGHHPDGGVGGEPAAAGPGVDVARVHPAGGVHREHRGHHEVALALHRSTQPSGSARIGATPGPEGGAGPRPHPPKGHRPGRGGHAGGVTLVGPGTGASVTHPQVVERQADDDRHRPGGGGEPSALLLAEAHHPVRRSQPEGRSAREHHRVDPVHEALGRQQRGLPGGRRPAAHLAGSNGAFGEQRHGAPRAADGIGPVAGPDSGHLRDHDRNLRPTEGPHPRASRTDVIAARRAARGPRHNTGTGVRRGGTPGARGGRCRTPPRSRWCRGGHPTRWR